MTDHSELTRRVLAATIGLIPFMCMFIVDWQLRREGWRVWSSPVYVGCVVALLLAAWFWARHFLRGSPRLGIARFLLVAALVWVAIRTDWIVETNYVYMGRREYRIFTPPVRPLWNPPQPHQFSSTAASWRHPEFFHIGGSGGPTEEPHLRINWSVTILKITLVSVSGYLLAIFLAFIYRHFRRKTVA